MSEEDFISYCVEKGITTEEDFISYYNEIGIIIKKTPDLNYQLIFDDKYLGIINYNLGIWGINGILSNAKMRASEANLIQPETLESYVHHHNANEFIVEGPFVIALGFVQRVIKQP